MIDFNLQSDGGKEPSDETKALDMANLTDYKLGQGTWLMAENDAFYRQEFDALSFGIKNGLTLIDTAEMYAAGNAEKLVGDVIRQFPRESLYIVSKVYPHNASMQKMKIACENTLRIIWTV